MNRAPLRINCWLILFLCVALAGSNPSAALAKDADNQNPRKNSAQPYALIFGTVYGPDQHPISGITVKIRRASDKKPKWERYSDNHGEFAARVPAGASDYIIWAQLKSRQASEKTEVKLHIDNDERRDVSLHLTK